MCKTCCLIVAMILGSIGMTWADSVESFRYRSKLIQVGDSKLSVLNYCGDPDRKEKSFDRLGELDLWTYNLGSGDFIYVVKFRNDKLVSIDQGSRGHYDSKRNGVTPTECRIEIVDWAKREELKYTWIVGVIKNKGGTTGNRVSVQVQALDRTGKLVNLEKFLTSPNMLPPGKEASFQIPIKNHPDIVKFVPTVTWETDI